MNTKPSKQKKETGILFSPIHTLNFTMDFLVTLVESSFFVVREDYEKIRIGMAEALFLMSDM